MSTAVLPRLTESMSAYVFLSEFLVGIIRDEPKRMRMAHWRLYLTDNPEAPNIFPACGTVGCIGGWTDIATGDRDAECLCLSDEQRQQLFYDEALCNAENQGTPEHAEAVIAHLLSFCERYRTQLEQTIVEPRA